MVAAGGDRLWLGLGRAGLSCWGWLQRELGLRHHGFLHSTNTPPTSQPINQPTHQCNRCGSLVRVNVYKNRIKYKGTLPPLPGSRRLAAALGPHHTALAAAAPLAADRPVHVITHEEAAAARRFLHVSHFGGRSLQLLTSCGRSLHAIRIFSSVVGWGLVLMFQNCTLFATCYTSRTPASFPSCHHRTHPTPPNPTSTHPPRR